MDRFAEDVAPMRKRRGRWCLVAASLAVARVPLTAILAPPAPIGADALRFFDHMALMRGDDGGGSDRAGWVRKFTRPVAVVLRGERAARDRAEAEAIATTLSAWTGLRFYLADRAQPGRARIVVTIRSHAAMRAQYGAGGPVCYTRTWGKGGRLFAASIEVSRRFADCLRHEFMHAVGFDNHWTSPLATAARPSVLALRFDAARASGFSSWDEMAIRLLYDWRLPAGTRRDVALPMARAILEAPRDG